LCPKSFLGTKNCGEFAAGAETAPVDIDGVGSEVDDTYSVIVTCLPSV